MIGFKYVLVYLVYLLPVFLLLVPIIIIGIAGAIMDQPDIMGAFATRLHLWLHPSRHPVQPCPHPLRPHHHLSFRT